MSESASSQPATVARQVENAKSLYGLVLLAIRLLPVPFLAFTLFTTVAAGLGWDLSQDKLQVVLIDVAIITGLLGIGAAVGAGLAKHAFVKARRERTRLLLSGGASDAHERDLDHDSSTTG